MEIDGSSVQGETILIVEDDPDISALLTKILKRAQYKTQQAYSGTEAQLRLEREKPDLVLLDLMLPGMTGEELIRHMRDELHLELPIIVISAKVSLNDKVDTISAGADDYITKPFEPEEVLVRVQAALRRSVGIGKAAAEQAEADPVLTYQKLCLDSVKRKVTLQGHEISLTNHEFDILAILMQAPDTVFSRERLYEMVWKSGYYGEDNSINVHVSNIRKKLKAVDPQADYIRTVWGIGFKLAEA